MSEQDPSGAGEPLAAASEARNLPVPISPGAVTRHERREGWLGWALRVLFGWKAGSIRANLSDVLKAGADETGFSPKESVMLQNILSLRERRVVDVMVPRADIVAVQQEIALGELMKVFANAGHSRLVVYDEMLDDAVGMVHIRDLVAFMTARAEVRPSAPPRRRKLPAGLDLKAVDLAMPLSAAKLTREILFVPPSMPAMDLLARMQTSRIHLALVVDEYGGADGVVSIEDIVEEIVGEIEDEHDEDILPNVVRQADGSFLADARAQLDDVTATVGPDFDVGEIANEVDTLAGYIATRIGRVPVRGELVPGPGPFEIEVLDADPRRVKKLKIYRSADRRNGHRSEPARRPAEGASGPTQPASPGPPSPHSDLPLTREASVKLSPDATGQKTPRQP
jgi:CBS domain containing-hemolysin-like protein